jgi:FkbM family methyltransferase
MSLKQSLLDELDRFSESVKPLDSYDEVWFLGDVSESFAIRAASIAERLSHFSGVVVSNIQPSKRLRISSQIGGNGYWRFTDFEGLLQIATKRKVLLADFNDSLSGCMFRQHFASQGVDVCDYIQLLNDLHICHTYETVKEERQYFIDHLDEFLELVNVMEDELSRQTLLARIKAYLTLDRRWLMHVAQGHNQFTSNRQSSSNLVLSNEEIYVDVGAAHGDTVASFFNFCRGEYLEIHAFEPDSVNYNGLKKLCNVLPRSYCYHMGLSDKAATLSFKEETSNRFGSRFEKMSDDSGKNVPVSRLDDVIDAATLIKIDVEGFENRVINGAKRIIHDHAPAMHIAGYHYPSDLISIVETVKQIHAYKNVAIRHSNGSLYDTNILFSDRQQFK